MIFKRLDFLSELRETRKRERGEEEKKKEKKKRHGERSDLTCHVAVHLRGPQGTTPIWINGVETRRAANQLVRLAGGLVDGCRKQRRGERNQGPFQDEFVLWCLCSTSVTSFYTYFGISWDRTYEDKGFYQIHYCFFFCCADVVSPYFWLAFKKYFSVFDILRILAYS